jgi:hypothetical protein
MSPSIGDFGLKEKISNSGHECLVFVLCVRFSVFVYRQRPCVELITRPRGSTDCHRSST